MSAYLYSCLSYLTCESHFPRAVSYCHLWPTRLYSCFFFTLPHKQHIFEKKILNKKCVY
jgi:hypothetical protein